MPPRAAISHRAVPYRLLGPGTRRFTRTAGAKTYRPQLPFLSSASHSQVRWNTTLNRRWWVQELRQTLRYTTGFSGIAICLWVLYLALDQEVIERKHPSPDQWSFRSRYAFRIGTQKANPSSEFMLTDWAGVYWDMEWVLKRLEDPNIDGKEVRDQTFLSDSPTDLSEVGKDISQMDEIWRRGYYDTIMLLAMAAEHVDGWVLDKSTRIVFPSEMVIGPSNPNPRPIPFGIAKAPLEENCKFNYFQPAHSFYSRILTTKGFTPREKMDAALAYASFLEYKNSPDASQDILKKALDLANESTPSIHHKLPYDSRTLVLHESSKPSVNQLKVLTAIATSKARSGKVDEAFPILVSILRARRQFEDARGTLNFPKRENVSKPESLMTTWEKLEKLFGPPPYPGRLPNGSSPPKRDAAEMCEEAALSAYIGEILFRKGDHEAALSWTKDAADISEEQLARIKKMPKPESWAPIPSRSTRDMNQYISEAHKACRECLAMSFQNWEGIVVKLANAQQEEAARQKQVMKKSRWLWWGGDPVITSDRWETEMRLVEEKRKRTEKAITDVPPNKGWLSNLFLFA